MAKRPRTRKATAPRAGGPGLEPVAARAETVTGKVWVTSLPFGAKYDTTNSCAPGGVFAGIVSGI